MLFDAHCHLQDQRLDRIRAGLGEAYRAMGVGRVVVNGTSEADWEQVEKLAHTDPIVKPSYGVHPWFVDTLSDDWREKLNELWSEEDAAVGEIGFDRWKEPFDIDLQWEVFSWQFDAAADRNKPVSIHCLKAWGILNECLKDRRIPDRGFLLHSFGGSMEVARGFEKMGAYFSFSGYFAQARKEGARDVFRRLPIEKILVETDAPDMKGPETVAPHMIKGSENDNHPLNIAAVYDYLADWREMDRTEFRAQISRNFRRFFGD